MVSGVDGGPATRCTALNRMGVSAPRRWLARRAKTRGPPVDAARPGMRLKEISDGAERHTCALGDLPEGPPDADEQENDSEGQERETHPREPSARVHNATAGRSTPGRDRGAHHRGDGEQEDSDDEERGSGYDHDVADVPPGRRPEGVDLEPERGVPRTEGRGSGDEGEPTPALSTVQRAREPWRAAVGAGRADHEERWDARGYGLTAEAESAGCGEGGTGPIRREGAPEELDPDELLTWRKSRRASPKRPTRFWGLKSYA